MLGSDLLTKHFANGKALYKYEFLLSFANQGTESQMESGTHPITLPVNAKQGLRPQLQCPFRRRDFGAEIKRTDFGAHYLVCHWPAEGL